MGAAVQENRRALLFHTQSDGENPRGGRVLLPGATINESNWPAACGRDFELPPMDSRLARRLPPGLKHIAQERARRPARRRHPPAKARGGVFFEADFHGLTRRGLQGLAVAGFVDREHWQRLLFHPCSVVETVRGGNPNLIEREVWPGRPVVLGWRRVSRGQRGVTLGTPNWQTRWISYQRFSRQRRKRSIHTSPRRRNCRMRRRSARMCFRSRQQSATASQ